MAVITAEEGRTPPKQTIKGPFPMKRFARDIYVRELSFEEYLGVSRFNWVESEEKPGEYVRNPRWPAYMVATCACDAEGRAIFTLADVPAIATWPSVDARMVWDAAFILNPDPEVQAEDEAKNSSAIQ